MAWFGNVSLGNFPDLAGAVNKLSESVKNIEKNFDSALGLEEKPANNEVSGIWPSASDGKTLFKPVMAFMGQRPDDSASETSEKEELLKQPSDTEEPDRSAQELHGPGTEVIVPVEEDREGSKINEKDGSDRAEADISSPHELDEGKAEADAICTSSDMGLPIVGDANVEESPIVSPHKEICTARDTGLPIAGDASLEDSPIVSPPKESIETETSDDLQSNHSNSPGSDGAEQVASNILGIPEELHRASDAEVGCETEALESDQLPDKVSPAHHDVLGSGHDGFDESLVAPDTTPSESVGRISDGHPPDSTIGEQDPTTDADIVNQDISASRESLEMSVHQRDSGADSNEQIRKSNVSDSLEATIELDKLKKEMKLMEAALLGAARQAQSKADEIARLMNENEQLKSSIEDLKGKSSEAEIDALRDEYHQRVAALERKVYALTRERDTLRREQSKKSDAAVLLKEKDEIISQVMAEGEELSKKQAAQEATIRKLRAQIREFEEEKQRLNSKLQVEETKVESIKKDKAATEKLLQETIEKNQAELAAQKEFYTNALNAAKEAEALAEARANNEARSELEGRLKEASERESLLVQAIEELRQTLSRTEQQAVFREDMLRRDIDDLQKRYQASELRYNELVTQVPESTRPLLRQIEAMQETAARRAEAWSGVERALNSRLEEAEAKAAAAEEKERIMNERLSQSLSRITVLETQIACLRTEQTQLSRSLEKERQRASESRQEYLAAMEEAATQEGRAKQLDDEIKELRSKHKQMLLGEITKSELLEKELERERAARLELEKTASRQISRVTSQDHISRLSNLTLENGNVPTRKLSTAGSIEESHFLQASLDSFDSVFSERRGSGEVTMSPYFLKSMTPSAFEAALRQKDGELASYISRLTSLESIRDSLSEELVKLTEQSEKLRAEAALLPGIRAELDALRRRHSSALELMGERDEALEELRNDIADLKEMYREQVDLLVNKIQMLSSSAGAA